MRHRTLLKLLLPLLIVGLLAASCGDDDSSADETNATTPVATAGGEPLVIGAAIGETGFISQFDIPPMNTALLAIDDLNAKGGLDGRQIEVVTFDHQSEVDQVGNAAIKALDAGAEMLVVSCDFDLGGPAAAEAQKRGVLAFSLCAGSPKMGPQGIGPLAYTVGTCGCSHGAVTAEFGYEELKLRTAYILTDPLLEYHQQMVAAFKSRWDQLGGELVGEDTYQPQDPSISAQITRIKQLDTPPDFIFLADFLPSVGTALRQLRAAGLDMPILSGGENFDGESWKESVPNVSDVYFSTLTSVFGDDPSADVNAMYERYQTKFGEAPPSGLAAAGYTMMEAWSHAVTEAGTTDAEPVAAELDQLTDFPTLVGPLTFTPDLHIVYKRETRIMKIENGKTEFVMLWTPSEVLTP